MDRIDISPEDRAEKRPLSLLQLATLHGVSKMIVKRAVWREMFPSFRIGREYRVAFDVANSDAVRAVLQKSASHAEALTYQHVYFIGSADAGPIKIGRALRPESRLKEIQIGYPYPLAVLATIRGGNGLERAYHQQFADHRLHGEWFSRHPDILAEIDRLSPTAFRKGASE